MKYHFLREARELAARGFSVSEIAARLGVTYERALYCCRRHKVEVQDLAPGREPRLSPVVKVLVRERGLSVKEVAEILGISLAQAYHCLNFGEQSKTPIDPELLRQLIAEGSKIGEVAALFDRSHSTIKRYLSEEDRRNLKRRRAPKLSDSDLETIKALAAQGETQKQIGSRYGVRQEYVSKYYSRHGIYSSCRRLRRSVG